MMRQPTFGIVVGMPPRKGKPDTLIKHPAWKEWEELKGRMTRLERQADALRKLTP